MAWGEFKEEDFVASNNDEKEELKEEELEENEEDGELLEKVQDKSNEDNCVLESDLKSDEKESDVVLKSNLTLKETNNKKPKRNLNISKDVIKNIKIVALFIGLMFCVLVACLVIMSLTYYNLFVMYQRFSKTGSGLLVLLFALYSVAIVLIVFGILKKNEESKIYLTTLKSLPWANFLAIIVASMCFF